MKNRERILKLVLVDALTKKTLNTIEVPYHDTLGRMLTYCLNNAAQSLLSR